ncbi:MAG: right-handed parallel beta-helix repeat-containing protein [Candidatus Thorarchaeota archaeon]
MKKQQLTAIILCLVIIVSGIVVYYYLFNNDDGGGEPIYKGGQLTQDETWSGNIFVYNHIVVPAGITLTIEPGTRLFFNPSRNYTNLNKLSLHIMGGTLNATGTADDPIWFTSDSDDPINGDWQGIEFANSNDSIIKYAIVEYAFIGIMLQQSKVDISHSIVRWVNAEGIYCERSSPVIESNLLYQNGYHEIALEQHNPNVTIKNNIFAGGHVPFIVFDSNATLTGNYFYNYNNTEQPAVSVAGQANATVINNRFSGFNNETAIMRLSNSCILVESNNDYGEGFIPIPQLDFEDRKITDLGYTPGDPEDRCMYVYPPEDATRRVVKRIGQGFGFGWSLEYANGYLWKLGSGDLVRIDPNTEENKTYTFDTANLLGPRGFCYDGEFFWANDHSLRKVVKFKVNETDMEFHGSFQVPEPDVGMASGLATDGTYLYMTNLLGTKLYELHKNGTTNGIANITGFVAESDFVWNGTHFISSIGSRLLVWTKSGNIVGSVYEAADGCSAMAWDGTYVWGIYKTCELWNDNKIFQIELKDTQLIGL